MALSRPDVRFKLVTNDKETLHTPGDGDLAGAIRALYGKDVAQNLLTVNFADARIKISGFIGKPTLLKGTRQWQTLFVNGRSIGNKMLAKAIDHAYQSQIPKSGFPFAVLNIEVDTASVDVNVHPQKSEIKFSDEGLVYRAMYKALTDALTRPMSAKKAEITLLPDSGLNAFIEKQPARPQSGSRPTFEPFAKAGAEQVFKTPEKAGGDNGSLLQSQPAPVTIGGQRAEQRAMWQPYDDFAKGKEAQYDAGKRETVFSVYEAREQFAKDEPLTASAGAAAQGREAIAFTDTDSGVATIWPIGQVDKTFIIAQSEDTLYLIDQHAAHERILYDKLAAAHADIPAQQLLMPLYVDMSNEDIALIGERRAEFLRLGVDAEPGGDKLLRVNSLPTDIKAEDAQDFINEIARMLGELRSVSGSDLRQSVLHMTACKAAIKAGQLLNMRQMRQLIIDLCNTEHPFTCPHGRPCMLAIDSGQLYKMFKRTGF